MKKRIISMFLIVSIIASLFAVSAVSTSAASKAAKPIITSILPINGKLNVKWYHNGKYTKMYGIAWQEWGSGKWKYNYTKKSSQKTFDITGLTPYKNYNIRVCAYDLNGNRSELSNQKVINWNASIISSEKTVKKNAIGEQRVYLTLKLGNQFYYSQDSIYRLSGIYYNVASKSVFTSTQGIKKTTGEFDRYSTDTNKIVLNIFKIPSSNKDKAELKSILKGVHKVEELVQVQAVFVFKDKDGHTYTHKSGWSKVFYYDYSEYAKGYLS